MRLLDLFCGAGGAAVGYFQAGFTEIVGVDIEPQPNYPFRFVQGDALNPPVRFEDFDLVHASPPCQAYSQQTVMHRIKDYPDLVPPTRWMLKQKAAAYVIENVPGAPLNNHVQVCGSGVGLERIRRHRWFETSFMAMGAPCAHGLLREPLAVTGHSENGKGYRERRLPHGLAARREAMGIDWMARDELSEAIPPAFTRFIGEQFVGQHG